MNKQLLLDHVRDVLARLEDTIIFALIERAQFRRNAPVYAPGFFGPAIEGESLMGYLLRETERIHARMRRYTSPDEHPFYGDLPPPILPSLRYVENPLQPNAINFNGRIRAHYEQAVVPALCEDGDDSQYGSSAVCDVACLQAISRRVHYGMFVAESKFRADPEAFAGAIGGGRREQIAHRITDAPVEREVVDRVLRKARAYAGTGAPDEARSGRLPETVARLYREWIIPLNKEVQVEYLLRRGPVTSGPAAN
jgi:chorismate mutase